MNDAEMLKKIQEMVKSQLEYSRREMDKALEDSDIPYEHRAFIRCLVRQMMALALQQKEERDFFYKQLAKEMKNENSQSKSDTCGMCNGLGYYPHLGDECPLCEGKRIV